MATAARAAAVFVLGASVVAACGDSAEPAAPAGCPAGTGLCAGACVDLSQDADHCGRCNHQCTADQVCANGVCDDGCGFGEMHCGDACVKPATDPHNCGGCGIECPEGSSCTSFHCACLDGQVACDGECVDLATSSEHCGACDVACAPGTTCVDGECSGNCLGGLTECGGECVDTQTDERHCGGCAQPCNTTTESCQSGDCVCDAPLCDYCTHTNLGAAVGQLVTGTTSDATESHESICALLAPAVAYRFAAPSAGSYFVDATGTDDPHVVRLVELPSCGDMACASGDSQMPAYLSLPLEAGQQVMVVISSSEGMSVEYALRIGPEPPCPEHDLGSVFPSYTVLSSLSHANSLQPACSPYISPEVTALFTAPATDTYLFNARSWDGTVAIDLRDGSCFGASLGCETREGPDTSASVTAELLAGQQVVVAVEGMTEGEFELNIDAAPRCPLLELGSSYPQNVDIDPPIPFGVLESSLCPMSWGPETTVRFTAPTAGSYTFDTAGSSGNTVLYLLAGNCEGQELACNDDYGGGLTSRITAPLSAGQTVVVVVDSPTDFDMAPATLHITGP